MPRKKNVLKSKTPYETACEVLGEPVRTLRQFNRLYGKEDGQAYYSQHRIAMVVKAVKNGHKFDWGSYAEDQRKWFAWFNMPNSAGSGFSLYVVFCGSTRSFVGARLSSKNREDARAIATIMEEDYKNWLVD